VIAALLVLAYAIIHRPLAADDTELHQVALDPADPSRERVGDLIYLGGLDIPRMDQNIGGLSGLRWDAESGRLLAITDDARWVWIALVEDEGDLTSIGPITSSPMLGSDGVPLTGKEQGDSESLTRSTDGGWLVGFERQHRIARFADLGARAQDTDIEPLPIFGTLEDNGGLEALAGNEDALFLCAERSVGRQGSANCALRSRGGELEPLALDAPAAIAEFAAVPTDADRGNDGSLYILFRSYDPVIGNTAGIAMMAADGTRSDLATLRAPLTVDNFEGLAVREEGDRTFLYIVSDDNFSGSQRTLLMKFEVLPES
jgi:hypothetical protein